MLPQSCCQVAPWQQETAKSGSVYIFFGVFLASYLYGKLNILRMKGLFEEIKRKRRIKFLARVDINRHKPPLDKRVYANVALLYHHETRPAARIFLVVSLSEDHHRIGEFL